MMKYSWQDLKSQIGEQAKEKIISDLQMPHLGGNKYGCRFNNPPHQKDNAISEWNSQIHSFHCHDCGNNYDILNHAKEKTDNATAYLYELAGLAYTPPKSEPVEAKVKSASKKGYDYLNSRGISSETLKEYKVTCDDQWIYFNFLNENNQTMKIKQRGIGEFKNGEKGKYMATKGGTNILYGMHLFKGQKALAITEGEIDSLIFHEMLKQNNFENDILSCAVPSGSGFLGWIDLCADFLLNFDKIIIIPDNDASGAKFIEDVFHKIRDKKIVQFEIAGFDKLNGLDLNDFWVQQGYKIDIKNFLKLYIPKLDGIQQSHNIRMSKVDDGFRSGFITFDYNDSGIRGNMFVLLTGRTNSGKTSYSRQFLISSAKNNVKSFMFVGEASMEEEKHNLSQICAVEEDIISKRNIGGRQIYYVSDRAEQRYDHTYGKDIFITDADKLNKEAKVLKISVFDKLLIEMEKMALVGVKVFLLDNLMVLCSQSGSKLNAEQKAIAFALKSFAKKHDCFIMLVAHPRGGEGQQRISGSQDIQNLADTILRYIRLDDENKQTYLGKMKLSQESLDRCSAVIQTEKVRKNGTKYLSMLEWDNITGGLYDLSNLGYAPMYEDEGLWTKAMHRYSEEDGRIN